MLQGPEGESDTELEPDERETLEDERAEKRERKRLLLDKQFNYALIRRLRPISDSQSVGAIAFIHLFGLPDLSSKITLFQKWQAVEEGEIQIRDNPEGNTDMYGYAVVRPLNDREHDIVLRVWMGQINSVVILPRSNNPLPRQGQQKSEILEQMELVPRDKINDYNVWLERMKRVE